MGIEGGAVQRSTGSSPAVSMPSMQQPPECLRRIHASGNAAARADDGDWFRLAASTRPPAPAVFSAPARRSAIKRGGCLDQIAHASVSSSAPGIVENLISELAVQGAASSSSKASRCPRTPRGHCRHSGPARRRRPHAVLRAPSRGRVRDVAGRHVECGIVHRKRGWQRAAALLNLLLSSSAVSDSIPMSKKSLDAGR